MTVVLVEKVILNSIEVNARQLKNKNFCINSEFRIPNSELTFLDYFQKF